MAAARVALRPPAACCAPTRIAVQPKSSAFALSTKGGDNQPGTQSTNAPGVYGIAKKLTRGQAKGTTGGAQTTYLDCSINGYFFGKFTNKLDDHFKDNVGIKDKSSNDVEAIKQARWSGYPVYCVKPEDWDTDDWRTGAPHAEDMLIVALATAYAGNANIFKTRGTPVLNQKPMLSIRINNSPCSRCAANLIRACATYGLSLRIKASFHYEADKAESGTNILTNAGVPVRHWRTAQIENKASGASGVKRRDSVTEVDWFKAARNDNAVQDAGWEAKFKRSALDNSASIASYAADTLMLA